MPDTHATRALEHGVPTIAVSNSSTLSNRTGSWKYIRPIYEDKVAPCNAGCPVGIDLEGVMNLLRLDQVDAARELLLRENPLPGVTGRVCDHPCQSACSRAQFDQAVNIHVVERMLGDLADAPATVTPRRMRPERVAVVGSGPAGLGCSYHLARLGYTVTVFEADPEPGGWLRYGVPEYRLPATVLARELERVRSEGVVFRCGVRVGGELAWSELAKFDAVFLASGARARESFEWRDHDLPDVRPAEDFLHEVRAGQCALEGRHVTIVGGDDLALDCARTALRLGAMPVVLFEGGHDDLTAGRDAVRAALNEGVRFEFRTRVVGAQIATHPDDEPALDAIDGMFDSGGPEHHRPRLVGLACVRVPSSTVPGAARRGDSVPGSAFVVRTDCALVSDTAQAAANGLPADLHRRGYVLKADEFGRTSRDGFFAGGDRVDEPRTVAHALGSGKRAAIGIDHWLRGKAGEALPPLDAKALRYGGTGNMSITRWRGDDPVQRSNERNEVVRFEQLNMAYFTHTPAAPDIRRAPGEASGDFGETALGLTREQAVTEAKRCFNCGVCNDCELCMILCPDVAIKHHSEGHGFSLSYKHCKGCGLCVAECPRGAMSMTREGL
ncbi:MAG: FAD-dependent oxidoreductase [Candidatus Eisenbacteria bacterium]